MLVSTSLPDAAVKRLAEAGITTGTRLTVGRTSPTGDPTLYKTDEVRIALRKETADSIFVKAVLK